MVRVTLLLVAMLMSCCENTEHVLEQHRWKQRLILVQLEGGQAAAELQRELSRHQAGIRDRDLVIIDLSPKAMDVEGLQRPDDAQLPALRQHAGLQADNAATFVLIGKDGGVKARQTGSLELEKFFALIDSMPMRQREMRERN